MFKKENLEKLRANDDDIKVSIYIPTVVVGDYEKNRIRWKNACNYAIKQLNNQGVTKTSFMKPALDLIDNNEFWARQSEGLAGFYSKNYGKHFHMINPCETSSYVGNSFKLLPVLQEIINKERVFVLALSHNEVRFFEAVKSGIYPVFIGDHVPPDMATALNLDINGNSIQARSAGNSDVFHGNDSGDDKQNIRLEQFMRSVDNGLMNFLHDENVPMVLAAVEEYHPMYKKITNYNNFSDHMIKGNPENLSPVDLHQQTSKVFEELFNTRLDNFERLYQIKSSENKVANGIFNIQKLAEEAKVDSLLINKEYLDDIHSKELDAIGSLALEIYDNGGSILIADTDHADLKSIHALNRY